MKIIYLHQYFNTPNTHGSTRSFELAIRLVRDGHDVHMITSQQDNKKNKNHFSVDLSSKKQLSGLSKNLGLKSIDNLVFCHKYRGKSWNQEFQISLDAVHHTIEALKTNLAADSSIVIIGSK